MEEPDAQISLMFSFYEGLERKGPGSAESTSKALSMLDGLSELSESPWIVEFGCGAGAASIALTKATPGHVTAVDVYEPFLGEVEAAAERNAVSDRITTLCADMAHPPVPDGSFDVVWSEGAIYIIGFEEGLRRWRRLLRSGGFVAVTEVTWLSDDLPQEIVDFWQSEYPDMTTIEGNLSRLRSAGFESIGHFILPAGDWENYYGPLAEHLSTFLAANSSSDAAQVLAKATQQEIDIWKQYGTEYGYVFYLGKVE